MRWCLWEQGHSHPANSKSATGSIRFHGNDSSPKGRADSPCVKSPSYCQYAAAEGLVLLRARSYPQAARRPLAIIRKGYGDALLAEAIAARHRACPVGIPRRRLESASLSTRGYKNTCARSCHQPAARPGAVMPGIALRSNYECVRGNVRVMDGSSGMSPLPDTQMDLIKARGTRAVSCEIVILSSMPIRSWRK